MSAAGPGRVGDLERTWNSSRPRAPSQHAALHSKARFWRGRRCCTSNRSTAASTARDRSAIAAWAAIAPDGALERPLPSPPLPSPPTRRLEGGLELPAASGGGQPYTLYWAAGAARRATSTGGRADANDGGGGGGGHAGYASGGRFFGGFEPPGRGPDRPLCPLGGQLRRKVRSFQLDGGAGRGRGGGPDDDASRVRRCRVSTTVSAPWPRPLALARGAPPGPGPPPSHVRNCVRRRHLSSSTFLAPEFLTGAHTVVDTLHRRALESSSSGPPPRPAPPRRRAGTNLPT